MILEDVKPLDIQTLGNMEDGLIADISEESKAFVFELVSKQLYSNPIGSVIREIASNCLDSHTEAGVIEPIVIRKSYNPEEGYSIEFQDFGVGMSPERVTKIYMNYFTSTKRDSNTQIGGFGIGSKTPLAYTDMFYITTIYNGKKYEYLFHKGENKPTLESMLGYDTIYDETPLPAPEDADGNELPTLFPEVSIKARRVPIGQDTDEHNGTTIRVVIDKGDLLKFEQELKIQLTYFDSVYFDKWNISNHYDIYEGKYFKYRSDVSSISSNKMHLCIGDVRYDIDFNKISLSYPLVQLPIGIKFAIGELKVTPSRETIRYEEGTAKLIAERIHLAIAELTEMFQKQNPDIADLKIFIKIAKDKPRVTFNEEKMHYLYLTGIDGINKAFKFAPIAKLNITKTPEHIFFMWEIVARITNGRRVVVSTDSFIRRRRGRSNSDLEVVTNELIAEGKYIIMGKDDKVSSYTDIYIGDQYYSDCYVLKRKKMDYKTASTLLGIKDSKKGGTKAKTLIEYLKITNEIVRKRGLKYSDLRPSPEWIRDYQKSVKETSLAYMRKKKQQVFIRDIGRGISETVKLDSLTSRTGILVYGFKEEKSLLKAISDTVLSHVASIRKVKAKNRDKPFKVIQVSNEVAKKLIGANNRKIVDTTTFLKTKFYRKMVTAYNLHTQDRHTMNQQAWKDRLIKNFYEDRKKIEQMINKYHYSSNSFYLWNKTDVEPMLDMVKMVDDFVAKYSAPLPSLLNHINVGVAHYPVEFKDIIDYVKSKGTKLLKKEYYLKAEEEPVTIPEEYVEESIMPEVPIELPTNTPLELEHVPPPDETDEEEDDEEQEEDDDDADAEEDNEPF